MFNFNFDVNKAGEGIKAVIEQVATTLGTTAQKLLEIGVRGMVAEGIFSAVSALILLVISIAATTAIVKYCKKGYGGTTSDAEDFLAVAAGIIAPLAFLGFFLLFRSAVTHLVAPEYALLMEIKYALQQK